MGLIPTTTYQTISFCYPSEKADDNVIRASFALDVRNNVGIGLSGGGLWKGLAYIGSFDGFIGFAHNVEGEDKPAVDALLADLSVALNEAYDVPLPTSGEEPTPRAEEAPAENESNEETSGNGEGE